MFEDTCTYSAGMLRRACGRPSITACVYCGEPFCEDHGQRGAEYQDVCNRRACVAKREDLASHLGWRREVTVFNELSMCAELQCSERMRHACSQCRLLFCPEHVKERDITDTRVRPPQKIRALVCMHCFERRKIWE